MEGIKLTSPYFPAYLRLFKWKIFELLFKSTSNELFLKFRPCFTEKELEKILTFLRLPEGVLYQENNQSNDMNVPKLNRSDFTEEELPYQEGLRQEYIRLLKEREICKRTKKYVEYFFKKVFYNEVGVGIVDQILKKYHPSIYKQVHLAGMPDDWHAIALFQNKFYTKTGLDTPYEMQLLDQVSIAGRGCEIFKRLYSMGQMYEAELKTFGYLLDDDQLDIKVRCILDILNVEPLKIGDREMTWNVHRTNLLLASLPLFNSTSLPDGDKDDWYYSIISAMQEDPYNRAALTLLQPDYEDVLDQRKKRKSTWERSPEEEELEIEDQEAIIEFRPQPEEYQSEGQPYKLQLRGYQEELVRPALAGKNTVIVAQTGAGKTEVAIHAALEHLKQNEGKSRIAMLVPKIPLVSQQRDRFLKYCRGTYYVSGIHGAESDVNGKGRKDDVLKAHIVVMTPQILVNMWQSVRATERLYVSDFTMIIFDEVHRATGEHPYVLVSQLIQKYTGLRPQIIGLTASLEVKTNRTTNHTAMLQQIYNLLATLDTPCLSTIQESQNLAELNEHVPKPDDSVVSCRQTKSVMRGAVHKYMEKLNGLLVEELGKLRLSKTCNCNVAKHIYKDTTKYDQWLSNVTQHLNKINSSEKIVAQANVKYLKVLVETLLMLDILPTSMGFDHMDKKIQDLKAMDLKQFSGHYDTIRDQLDKDKNNTEFNEEPQIVTELKNTLVSHFKNTPDSRCIIFVGQRVTAARVCAFLNKSGILKTNPEGPEAFGYVLGVNNQGTVHQTFKQQEDTLRRFASGHLKVIVSTSVVEEGLDVTSANLIIKYNFATSSAIQHIQQKGRARAKNSRSILLVVNSMVNENANNALIAEKCMQLCVDIIQKNGPKILANEVERTKAINKKQQENDETQAKRNEDKLFEKYEVNCKQCALQFCTSDSIKKVYSNYFVMDPLVWNHLDLKEREKSKRRDLDNQTLAKILCINPKCRTEIGKVMKTRGVYVPQFAINRLTFTKSGTGAIEEFKKWQTVAEQIFFIAKARESDFRKMLNALNTSEANQIKKKKLDLDSQEYIKECENADAMEKRRREEKERKLAMSKQPKMTWGDEEDIIETVEIAEKKEEKEAKKELMGKMGSWSDMPDWEMSEEESSEEEPEMTEDTIVFG